MKLSISLSESDLSALDEFARTTGLRSRSAAVQHAISLLRHADLEQDYEAAWEEWDASGERAVWEATTGDGPTDASG